MTQSMLPFLVLASDFSGRFAGCHIDIRNELRSL
jgi:hypothetical protein